MMVAVLSWKKKHCHACKLKLQATFMVLFSHFSTLSSAQEPSSVPPRPLIGKFTGYNQSGNQGGPVTGDPYPVEITVNSEGGIILELPSFGCGNIEPISPSFFENGKLEFVYNNEFGSCGTPTPSLIYLNHKVGSQWDYRWESGDQYGVGILTFQCLEECGDGFRCNSILYEDGGTPIGTCIPLGDSFPLGIFSGFNQRGGPIAGDPYNVEITVNNDGGILLELPAFGCGNTNPRPPNVFEKGKLEWVHENDFGDCGGLATFLALNHKCGSQWDYRWENGERYGVGVLTFQCLEECGDGFRCNSILTEKASAGLIGECIPESDGNGVDDDVNCPTTIPLPRCPDTIPDGGNDDSTVTRRGESCADVLYSSDLRVIGGFLLTYSIDVVDTQLCSASYEQSVNFNVVNSGSGACRSFFLDGGTACLSSCDDSYDCYVSPTAEFLYYDDCASASGVSIGDEDESTGDKEEDGIKEAETSDSEARTIGENCKAMGPILGIITTAVMLV